jgi:transcriptional regulator GlxA family with amidase domain
LEKPVVIGVLLNSHWPFRSLFFGSFPSRLPLMPRPNFRHIGFILLPRFSLAALGSALGIIEAVNDVSGEATLSVHVLGEGAAGGIPKQEVQSASQIALLSNATPDVLSRLDMLFVVGDAPLAEVGHDNIITRLRAADAAGVALGGIGTGAWMLARAGLLDGFRATIHWPYTALFAERFPDVVVSSHVFEIDRNRFTAAGGQAAQDLMLALVTSHLGADVTAEVLDQLGIERARAPDERQRVPLSARIGGGQPKLTEAVSLMEANFEEPLPTEEIARLVGVSRRQLERLFKQHLDSLPSRYYLEMRLARARQLLRETSQSILQIGLSCGFSSGPHFSSAYRAHFQLTPRDERGRRLNALAASAAANQANTTGDG